ncbi:transposase [Actinoplanes xinjiangensis]|uniref:Transposase n=1 Tax=Actinoplanes xinjiangensis TaxID=512350 RepID=A0A316EFW2_9ACTN|nr:transposase [Actinoplanes xinjiangensis]PWK21830.1 transposase [Actinoplanes xinjiangensis]GIF45456.1 transposase [Actinoplanes xinjiangensis]
MPRPSKYPEQFRKDAVDLVRSSGRTIRDVGRELGVNHETLRNWVSAAKRAEQGPAASTDGVVGQVSPAEREELNRLRKKVAELELEKEILRKAAQYFAKEMGR